MKLQEINELTNHRITGGSEYGWNCYPDARYLDYESDFAYISVIYSTVDQSIYEATIDIKQEKWPEDQKPYRFLNLDYKDIMVAEAKKRKVKWKKAWDDVKYIDLEVEDDFLEKAEAIFNGKDFDKRIKVPLELEDDLMLQLCMEAHKRDITLNQMVEEILRTMIQDRKRDDIMEGYEQDFG